MRPTAPGSGRAAGSKRCKGSPPHGRIKDEQAGPRAQGRKMRFWREHRERRRLEAELRAARHEPPQEFVRKLVARLGKPEWATPRLRIGLGVALGTVALAAVASAGGIGLIENGTKGAGHVIKRATNTSSPQRVTTSAATAQYVSQCGTPSDPCKITINDSSAKEPKSGTATMSFTVSLDATPVSPIIVDYTTSGGNPSGTPASPGVCSATSGFDYVPKAGVLVFPTGVASETITITICADKSPTTASQETYKVILGPVDPQSDPATIYRSTATGTILT
jgi:hypothetical protein